MRVINVGVIGCGGIAQMMHLPTLAERPDLFRIAALADISRTTLEAVAERHRAPLRTTDFREILARPEIEMVLLLSSGSHKEAAIAALKADKHVFSEKPLGFGFGELDEIAAAARSSRGRLMVGYHKRFDPSYQRAREAVRAIADLRFVQVTVLHPDDNAYREHHALLPARPYAMPTEAELNRETAAMLASEPYPALLDQVAGRAAPAAQRIASFLLYDSLLHDVNAVRGMIGEPEEVSYATCWNDGFAQTSVSRFANDVRASVSWISLPGIRHYEETLLFVGPKSRVKLVFPSPYLRHAATPLVIERMEDGDLVEEHRVVSYEEAFRAELHHFHRAILEGKEPRLSIDEAYRDTAWIQAIAAAFNGKAAPVPIPREADTLPG
jgi:predicted dehydrogenase